MTGGETPTAMDGSAAVFETHRRYLVRLAYRLLGSVAEAEDAVQDGYLRWHGADRDGVADPRSFLSRTVTRLCLDRLRERKRRRESYVGPWLPEPLIDHPALAVEPEAGIDHDVTYALMLSLERLSPLERAAFLLHDVFGVGFGEIAATLGRSEAACRQLASRARTNVREARPRFESASEDVARLSAAFFAASRKGDTTVLRELLADSASLHTDGGGRKSAALNIIVGAEKICRLFAGLSRKYGHGRPLWTRPCVIDGLPGVVSVESDGTRQATALEISGGVVTAIYVVRNPDKLRHLAALFP